MFTLKRLSIAATVVIVLIVVFIEIGVLESSARSLYIWERPVNTQTNTAVEDALHPVVEPDPPATEPPPKPIVPTIAFLVPGRSIAGWTLDDVPLLQVFLPSLLDTISQDDFRGFQYVIYFGCDVGDPLYDADDIIAKLYERVEAMSAIRLNMFSFGNTKGKPVLVWNRLFEKAFQDGCHYFYQVNDDVRFITGGWTRQFVDALRGNPLFPDLGVTGPKDVGSAIFTQSFVSRIHMHIFGYFYPPLFDNWYSDDWMTHVYDDVGSVFNLPSVLIRNENSQGTRYQVDHSGGASLDVLLRNGKVGVREFLDLHVPGPSIYSDPLHTDSSRRRHPRQSHVPGDTAVVNGSA